MSYLIFIKCSTINEDYQIKNSHSVLKVILGILTRDYTNYMCKTKEKEKNRKEKKSKKN